MSTLLIIPQPAISTKKRRKLYLTQTAEPPHLPSAEISEEEGVDDEDYLDDEDKYYNKHDESDSKQPNTGFKGPQLNTSQEVSKLLGTMLQPLPIWWLLVKLKSMGITLTIVRNQMLTSSESPLISFR